MNHFVILFQGFQFVGDVGGMFGLWIGVSALGMVQLIEFLLVAVYSKVRKIYTSKRRIHDMASCKSNNKPISAIGDNK